MSVIWRKIWRDLANNKARSSMVVISTTVGVFALGLVFGLAGVVKERLTDAHSEALPAHIAFRGGPFVADTVDAIEQERGVDCAQGETVVPIRWRFGGSNVAGSGESESEWRDGVLVARADRSMRSAYDDQRIDVLRLLEGRWPGGRLPGTHEPTLDLDRLSAEHFGVAPGTRVVIESGARGRPAWVQGIVHAYDVLSPAWGGTTTFYATPETVAQLTGYGVSASAQGEVQFNRLQVRLDRFTPDLAEEMAERIEDRLERTGLTVEGYEIEDPRRHPMQEQVDAVMIVLGVMGGLCLGLSGFLIVTIMGAILARQVRQIGVMKAVGATLLRITGIYLAITVIYGALALLVAVPLGVLGAQVVATWLLGMFNVALTTFHVQPLAVCVQVAVGLAVPPAAAFVPTLNAARITVREATSDHGLDGDFGQGWLDEAAARVQSLPAEMALSLRNTFRRKGRVALTLAMLTFSGAVFMVVMSTQAALESTFQIIFELEGDAAVSLEHAQSVPRLVEGARQVPGVRRVEVWHERMATAVRPPQPRVVDAGSSRAPGAASDQTGPQWRPGDGQELPLLLTGVPMDSRSVMSPSMFQPRIIGGRGLRVDDSRALLINNRLVVEEGVQIGDVLELKIDGETSEWTVVGSYLSLNVLQDVCYVPREALGRETHTRGEGSVVKVVTQGDDVGSQRAVIRGLTEALEAQNIEVTGSYSVSQQWQESRSAFGVLISLLLAMALLVALVGSIGLMSTMSINVVERTREIGVMRAIGASRASITAIFITEGVLVGMLSWLLALPLSLPGAYAMGAVVGQAIVKIPLDRAYSVEGALLWLLIVVLLSALASLWPALRATGVSVRESLAYE